MKQILLGILVLFLAISIMITVEHFNVSDQIKNKSSADAEYLQWALQYFVDTRTNLCYAKTSVNTLTIVTCSPEVLKIAHPIK